MNTVLVLGGYGGFGTRLCHRLAQDGWSVIVAGRSLEKATTLAAQLPSGLAAQLDRTADLRPHLAEHDPDLLIDAAGPFQGSDYRVAEACIACGIPYLDLADARQFVVGVDALNESALAAGVPIISGASSVPALSGAVIRELAEDFDEVTKVDVALSASDKAVAGTSVGRAILSYVGKPIMVWRGKRWVERGGWQELGTVRLHAHGSEKFARKVALADVPDLDIWPRDLPGQPATHFTAGPEFGFQVWALWFLSWLVRWRLLPSLEFLVHLMLPLQAITRRFSDGRSAMVVEVSGRSGEDYAKRRWELLAQGGHGPEIPVLAAQLLARRLREKGIDPGARDARAELSLTDFAPLLEPLEIEWKTIEVPYVALYKRVLGDTFERLPKPVQDMHQVCGDGGASGSATVERGSHPLARLAGWIMRFPTAGEHDLHVTFTEQGGRETWLRDFGGRTFRSVLAEHKGRLTERFGPLRFAFELPVSETGLEMKIVGWTCFGVPLPLWLAPWTRAYESVVEGRFAFDVAIGLPLVGMIVRYKGTLQ